MSDVHLIWFSMDDSAPTADKVDVRAWADELGLPDGPLSRANTTSAFLAACEVVTTYEDAAGQTYQLSARQVARKDEFVTFEVTRNDGKIMAQVKFFSARKSRTGIVANTHVVKSIVRKGLDPSETLAARAWLVANEAQFRVEQGQVPWYIVRRLVRVALLEAAIPVLRRKATFFAYADDLEQVHRAGAFLQRTVSASEFVDLPIDDTADMRLFAESADVHLLVQAAHLLEQVEAFVAVRSRDKVRRTAKMAGWTVVYEGLLFQLYRHERRLRCDLAQTRSTLSSAYEQMTRLVPSASLLSVKTR